MAECANCGKNLRFFDKKYDYKDETGKSIKYCSECNNEWDNEEKEKKRKATEKQQKEHVSFNADMKYRFKYIINKFKNNEVNVLPPKDAKDYDNNNCWICLDTNNSVKDYYDFKNICEDCKFLIDNWDNKNIFQYIERFSGIKREKREFLIHEREKITDEIKKKRNKILKENEKLKEQNAPVVIEYCKKYLSNKDLSFKGMILYIYCDEELSKLVLDTDLDFLKDRFMKIYQDNKELSPSTSEEYDEHMSIESSCNTVILLIQDVTKLKKVMETKNIKTDYIQIIEEMSKLIDCEIKDMTNQLTLPAYKKISKITTTDKKKIIHEYLKLGFDTPSEMIIENLFDKFNLKYTHEEINKLLNECLEDNELIDFEKSLGTSKINKICDFKNLNGHQFEDWLKELFTILGYQVVRTKLSGDQGADLIIKKENKKSVVQAKKYQGGVSNKAIQEVVASKKHYDATEAIVVTTGNFTKSAMELAKSNHVELWDGKKLNKIVEEINNNQPKENKKENSSHGTLNNDIMIVKCPYCETELKIELDELPNKNKPKTHICPECTAHLSMQLPEEQYNCKGCKQSFNSMKELSEHKKSCKQFKERLFKCNFCEKEFRLDDNELEELRKKGELKLNCPSCKKSNIIIR